MSIHHERTRPYAAVRAYLVEKVFERDRGICIKCGKDNVELLNLLMEKYQKGERVTALLKEHNISKSRWQAIRNSRQFPRVWDMDHIIPLSDGGEWVLDNIQTLCLMCHALVTLVHTICDKNKKSE